RCLVFRRRPPPPPRPQARPPPRQAPPPLEARPPLRLPGHAPAADASEAPKCGRSRVPFFPDRPRSRDGRCTPPSEADRLSAAAKILSGSWPDSPTLDLSDHRVDQCRNRLPHFLRQPDPKGQRGGHNPKQHPLLG